MVKFSRIIFLGLAIFSFFLESCADSEAEIVSSTGAVVFDFADEKNPAESHLSVFIQTKSEVQRADYFTALNEATGWNWTVYSPEMFNVDSKQYAFSQNLKAPRGKSIPQGKYIVVYNDAAGNSDETNFDLKYDKKLLNAKSEEAAELIQNKAEYLAIYDDQDELLFMGKKKNSWNDNSAILKEYKIAHKTRVCYANPSNTVICLMPPKLLKEEQ